MFRPPFCRFISFAFLLYRFCVILSRGFGQIFIAFVVFSCYDRIEQRKEVIFTETINDRMKQVRKSLKLNQSKFGEQITLAQTYLSQIERGDREVTEKILKLVCLQFNVSEHWLRTGEGRMFEESSDSLVTQLCEKYKLDNMARILLETFISMPPSERDAVMSFAQHVVDAANRSAAEQENESLRNDPAFTATVAETGENTKARA